MSAPYAASPIAVRADLAAAHARAWERLGEPGTWWDARTRLAIAAETRRASGCALCRRRKAALSPAAVADAHDARAELPEAVVEIVHRVATDPGRLTESWFRGILAAGLDPEHYVETVSIVVHTIAIDTFARGLGLDALPLPQAQAGEASRERPPGAKPGPAWVPWLDPEEAGAAELYGGRRPPNVMKAMSLVPAEVTSFFDLVAHQYQSAAAMRDFSREYRAISHAQIELLAARVSALNRCLY